MNKAPAPVSQNVRNYPAIMAAILCSGYTESMMHPVKAIKQAKIMTGQCIRSASLVHAYESVKNICVPYAAVGIKFTSSTLHLLVDLSQTLKYEYVLIPRTWQMNARLKRYTGQAVKIALKVLRVTSLRPTAFMRAISIFF